MTPEPIAPASVLLLIVSAAPPATQIEQLISFLQSDHWDVHVIATPTAMSWINPEKIARQTSHPVQSRARRPDEPKSLPKADAIALAPATFNTINKWSAGINDTLALGILNESLGGQLPIIVAPYAKAALSRHPVYHRNLEVLRRAGVDVIDNEAIRPPAASNSFNWMVVVERLRSSRLRSTNHG
ncbi:flavoprotein [Micromonospora peucetia]|uniref:flavoprotein n=1 Tax=Micromonospora peucetia TaxID=47871 RepID=UPI0033343149